MAKVKQDLDEKIVSFHEKREDSQTRFPAADSVKPKPKPESESEGDSDDSDDSDDSGCSEVHKTPPVAVEKIQKKRKKSPKKSPKKHKPVEADEDE